MDEIYRRLAARLDALPHGFPRTPGGVELRILQKIFSPEDAALAARLMPMPETVEELARRLHLQADALAQRLEGMAARGQILAAHRDGQTTYTLAPFVVGIYELQLGRMDAELAGLFEEYAPTLVRELGGSRPALARVVPVGARIEAKAEVLRYESVRELLSRARSFRLMECICRKEQALGGHPCSHTRETCLPFSSAPEASAGTDEIEVTINCPYGIFNIHDEDGEYYDNDVRVQIDIKESGGTYYSITKSHALSDSVTATHERWSAGRWMSLAIPGFGFEWKIWQELAAGSTNEDDYGLGDTYSVTDDTDAYWRWLSAGDTYYPSTTVDYTILTGDSPNPKKFTFHAHNLDSTTTYVVQVTKLSEEAGSNEEHGDGIYFYALKNCGSRLISEGDPREKLVNECGKPSDVESWEEERYDYFDRPPPARHDNEFERYGNAYRVRAFIRVEVWTYNYGPSRFIDYVRLENGIVRKIYSGGYGY